MQDGVLLFDAERQTAFANEALEHHLGTRPDTLGQVYPPSLRGAIERARETDQVEVAEIETGAPTRWLRVTATPAGADGSVLAVIADVTEARRLDSVRRDFVANASHELKTPAASIQAAAETLLNVWQEDPAAVPRFAAQLEGEAVRLSRIVADLLDLSRLESGSELQDRVHLDALVREETSRFEGAAVEAGLTMEVEVAHVPEVRGSGRDLSLLIRNLLDNAVRYTRSKGTIVASVSADNGSVIVRVSDTGTGSVEGTQPGVRALLSGGSGSLARDRRHRPRTRDRSACRREPRRYRDGGERARAGLDVRGAPAVSGRRRGREQRRLTARPTYAAGPMTTLFLIRHGLTAVTGKTLYGRTPGVPLDDRGLAQAEALADRLATVRLTAVYSSPLDRCMQTMAPLAKRQHLDVVPRDGLLEMDVGAWTGRPLAQVRRTRLWKELIHRPSHVRFPEGESFADAQARALTEIDAIAARHPRGRVAVDPRRHHPDADRAPLGRPPRPVPTHDGRSGVRVGRSPERGGPVRPARQRHGQLGALRSPAAHREEPARIGRMDLGPVDRITADAIGEPGLRTFYLQARHGTDLVTLIVEKEQVRLLAASVLDLLATIGLETGTGPDEEEMDLEQPFEARWRAGRLSIGYEDDSDQFLLENSRSSSPSSKKTTRCCSCRRMPRCCGCSRRASRCWRSRDMRRSCSIRAGPPVSSAAIPSTRRDTRVPR